MTTKELGIRAAEETIRTLREALIAAGLNLPSLGLDSASCARDVPAPLVDLGRCDVETARRLAEVIGAGGPSGERRTQ
ncbi:hypothetical protein ACIO3O_06360 [Streptomyces sp. NPDC087440]|uniref:hypothetical protein n=1 Tax=Streptomyces sp. NPDC087440 TaxID=3365790 RepID=UPI00382DC36C